VEDGGTESVDRLPHPCLGLLSVHCTWSFLHRGHGIHAAEHLHWFLWHLSHRLVLVPVDWTDPELSGSATLGPTWLLNEAAFGSGDSNVCAEDCWKVFVSGPRFWGTLTGGYRLRYGVIVL
jgi:hypothetical protein